MRSFFCLLFLFPAAVQAEPDTIIQILNTHYVTPYAFATDLKDQGSEIEILTLQEHGLGTD